MVDPVGMTLAAALAGLALGPPLAGWSWRYGTPGPPAEGWWRGRPVSRWQVTAMAAVAGALFGALGFRFAGSATLPAWSWLAATGMMLAIIDLRCRRLPHPLTAATAVGGVLLLGLAAAVENRWPQLVLALAAGAVVFLGALLLQLAFPAHTGGGDTALYGALALYLGWFGWAGLVRGGLLATGLAALAAIIVGLRHRRWTATFPAGPPLIAGTLAAILVS